MRLLGWAGLGTLSVIMLLQLRGMDTPLRTPDTPGGIVGYELAFTPARATAIVSTWRSLDRIEAARVSLGFDGVFLLVYPWFLRGSISLLQQRLQQRSQHRSQPRGATRGAGDRYHRLGSVLAGAVLGCTPLDALENALLWQMLTMPPTVSMTVIAGAAATLKLALVLLALLWCTHALWQEIRVRLTTARP